MERSGQRTSSSVTKGQWFDGSVAWRFAVALLGTAIALLLIATIVGAIAGIPLLLLSCKPFKDLIARRVQCTPKKK
jgi:hypothetical protein